MTKGPRLPGVRLPQSGSLSRRRFLASSSSLAMGLAVPGTLSAEPTDSFDAPQADFPPGIPVYRQTYLNWCGELRVPDAWTAAPRGPEDVVTLVNWALDHGWRVRPKGMSHGWSPLLLPSGRPLQPTLLVDGSQGLDQVWLGGVHGARTVTAQTGLTLERLWGLLGEAGLAVAAPPAPGHLTLGGALAIGAHGSALALDGPVPGWTFGSLSNAVLALDAVVWDEGTRRYRVRTFHRGEPAIEPLLAHAGRAFLTAATLQVGTDVNLRCRSFTEIPAAEVFAAPGSAGPRCLQAWAGEAGRVEATWFPFQDCPWLRVWSTAPAQPDDSLVLEEPYPFTFANWVSREDSDWTAAQLRANPWRTPPFLALAMDAVRAGLLLTGTGDVWGPSRFSSLHVEPSTLRYHVSGHAILCRSGDIQRVASECFGFVAGLLERERCRGVYPVNGPVDLRISGLDQLAEVGVPGAREALLSPLRPRPDHPEWDCVVWLEVLTLPGTPGSARFYTELEAWLLGHYVGDYAAVRMEWAKGWGYSPQGAWTAETVLGGHIPDSYSSGQAETGSWLRALEGLHALDPQAVYGNVFLDGLFKARR